MESTTIRNVASASSGRQESEMTKNVLHHMRRVIFVGVHLMGLFAVHTGIRWEWVVLAIASYYLRMFAVTAGYHRYFAHRAFKTSRVAQFGLACLAMTSGQKGVLWWAAHHRHHHKHSDGTQDVHSPLQRGFWFSHLGWMLTKGSQRTHLNWVKDFARYPELALLDRYHVIPPTVDGFGGKWTSRITSSPSRHGSGLCGI
jgi:stearoyl-CoA desaturase (Delta-9 desaturase)